MAGPKVLLRLLCHSLLGRRLAARELRQTWQAFSALEDKFNQNVNSSTAAFDWVVTDREDIAGLPLSLLEAAARSFAGAKGQESSSAESGPWRLTLESELVDIVSKFSPLRYLNKRSARKNMFLAFSTRASGGQYDNRQVVLELLKLRRRSAAQAGFSSFAEEMMEAQMLGSVAAVDDLLTNLSASLRPLVQSEMSLIQEFAASKGHEGSLEPWDRDYWEERFREAAYAVDEEDLRNFFALPRVLDGMFQLAFRLFGVKIEHGDAPPRHHRWMYFRVWDTVDGRYLGSFYLNPHAEEENTQTLVPRSPGKLPQELISLHMPRPVGGMPCLMRLKNIESLFHEFGHVLATMFTDRFEFSEKERDNIEVMSFFMECWMYHKQTFDTFAIHYATGEPLPADAFHRIVQSASLGSARLLLWYVARAALDMELHARFKGSFLKHELHKVEHDVLAQFTGMTLHDRECWVCIFDHIFDGEEYAANEYSYVWGQVLAWDAFEAFEQAGLNSDEALAKLGRRFRETVLGVDATRPFLAVYRDFRGRDATIAALLRHKSEGSKAASCQM